jgi:hypothetical protein
LLDVDFDEAQVARRVALELGDVGDAQAGMRHGLVHGDAVSVLLREPFGVEVSRQCARAQEHRLVALAFFLGEAHDLQPERQPPTCLRQFTHAGHGHQDPQAAVVLAAVAHGVVVAAGQQAGGRQVGAVVHAHHVADSVDLDIIEAAVGLHPVRELLRHRPVGIGQVSDRQLAAFLHSRARCARPGVSAQSQTRLPSVGSAPNLSSSRISAIRSMLRSALGKLEVRDGLCSRRSNVLMICCLLRPVPRGPRTARMKGQPNFWL